MKLMKKLFIILLLFPCFSVFSQNIDIDLLKNINARRVKQLDGLLMGVSNSVGPVTYGFPIAQFAVAIIMNDSSLCRQSAYLGASVVTSAIITNVLKYSIQRARPFETYSFIEKLSDGKSPSFPSGHTSGAFSLATSLSVANPKWYIIVPSFVWATSVGYSRMALGVHYPSDVLVGAVIGTGSAYLTYKMQRWLIQKPKRKVVF